jgi:DnaJ-class molecular chaperone
MESALKVLNRYGFTPGPGSRRKRFVSEVTCAYCGGRGADPKFSSASGCPVCRGAGWVQVTPPVVSCRLCDGSGRVNGDLVCLTCKGLGVVPVPLTADTCPRCGGRGEEGIFYCNACKGQGIV